MASLNSIPRSLLLLRSGPFLRPTLPLYPATHHHLRYASASSKSGRLSEQFRKREAAQQQRIIPQPDKYRPPSHGRRTPRSETQQKTYGPALTEEDKKRMREKKYPNMMSPEGTFSHWFLNNKLIHLWITMGILVTLGGAAWYIDFTSKTIYKDLLPTRKDYYRHPFESSKRAIEVYRMHVYQQSQEAADRRLRKAEDVEKRKQYRLERIREAEARGEEYVEDPRYWIGEDGVRRRRVKRWFGIWE